jgi:hypothetical protein
MISPAFQLVGNVCAVTAALLYAVPLQMLLSELSRKRDDGGGFIAGVFIIVPMWILLMVALLCMTANGGFDSLQLSSGWLCALVIGAALSMAVLSFMAIEFPRHPNFFMRVIGRVPVYAFTAVTMLLVLLYLNTHFTFGIPFPFVKLTWLVCAAVSLLLCGGFLGYRIVVQEISRVKSLSYRFSQRGPSEAEVIAKISTLDPLGDFSELLKRTGQYERRAVREAATARLRTDPAFIENLAATLTSGDASPAMEFLSTARLSSDEQTRLAFLTRMAMQRFIGDIPAPNYMSPDRRKQLLRWGRKTFPAIAEKFSATEVDFRSTFAAFEYVLRPDNTCRR